MVTLSDGCTLQVQRHGHGQPVLIIHAGAEDMSCWSRQADYLANAGYSVASYDRRGTGGSGRQNWPSDGSISHARDAAELLTQLDLCNVLVLGVSSGAIIAMDLLLQASDRVTYGFAHEPPLFCFSPRGTDSYERLRAAVSQSLTASPAEYQAAYAAFLDAWGGPGTATGTPLEVWDVEAPNAEAFTLDDVPHIAARTFSAADLRELAPRLLLTSGTTSPPELAEICGETAKTGGIHHETLAGQGHTPHRDDPSVFVELLARYRMRT